MDDQNSDHFDRLRVRDPQLANRFQRQLKTPAMDSLGARVLENNDLDPESWERELSGALLITSVPVKREGI